MDKVMKGFSMITAIILAVNLFAAGCWIGNMVKLVRCDFQEPYKGEIIHLIGLIPYASIVTVWNSDK